jgi:tight adherence protein C
MIYWLLLNIVQIKIDGKIQNIIGKRGNNHFLLIFVINHAARIGRVLTYIKYKKFVLYIEKIDTILKVLGSQYNKINPYQFVALQLIISIGIVLFLVLMNWNFCIILVIGIFAFLLPFIKIKEELKKRKELIIKQLPDMSDLLSIMLEAGLDFYTALDKAIEILCGPLSDELKEILSKISLGYDKSFALTEMTRKIKIEQLNFFAKTLNMALDSGTAMTDTLRRLAISLRNDRIFYIEKKAHEAPVKILVPLILFIFPTIFIVVFGPIVINFIKMGF